MTYLTAFIMVGRVAAWCVLLLASPFFFVMLGATETVTEEDGPKLLFQWVLFAFGLATYVAVIYCARYIP